MRFLTGLFVGIVLFFSQPGPLSSSHAQPIPPKTYEIWVTDQSRDVIQIYHGTSLKLMGEIPVDQDDTPESSKPHTIEFSPDFRYAYVANVGAPAHSRNLLVIRAKDRKIVSEIPTGPGAHMIRPSPNGKQAFAAIAGDDSVVELITDTNRQRFRKGRTIRIKAAGSRKARPICLGFSANGKKLYVSNAGDPRMNPETSGFIAVVNIQTGREIKRIPNLASETCGLTRTQDGTKLFFTMGGGVGKFGILDLKTDQIIDLVPTGTEDPHGLALMPGGRQIWITNRMSNSLVLLNPTLGTHLKTYFDRGERPDLLAFSPNGAEVIVTLRGKPATRIPGGIGGALPGLLILRASNGEVLSKIPMVGDPHGIATRPR